MKINIRRERILL